MKKNLLIATVLIVVSTSPVYSDNSASISQSDDLVAGSNPATHDNLADTEESKQQKADENDLNAIVGNVAIAAGIVAFVATGALIANLIYANISYMNYDPREDGLRAGDPEIRRNLDDRATYLVMSSLAALCGVPLGLGGSVGGVSLGVLIRILEPFDKNDDVESE